LIPNIFSNKLDCSIGQVSEVSSHGEVSQLNLSSKIDNYENKKFYT